jgi:glycosyltransferase involved in cell wall biosynthesis
MNRVRLGVLLTHPVQYHAPLFRTLAAREDVDVTVFFAHRPSPEEQGWEFGVAFEWDVDLTSGYRHEWLVNRAARPSASTFEGCDTPEIAAIIGERRFDAFLVMGWHARSYWQAMRGCWRARVPVLVRGDSQLVDDPLPKRLAKRLTYPLFVRRFAACLSVGTRSTEYFRYYGARRIVASPHFVDNAFFAQRADALRSERAALRARWGIPAGALVLAFAGKLIPRKRPLDVLQAVARSGRRNVCVLFAGDGELREACEAEAARLGVDARFAGFLNQSRIPEAYVASDALVLPSSQETWGLVVNEAMACGRPALVSDIVGCAPDLVVEGRTGFRFALGDVEAIAGRIAAMADDPSLAATMGADARRHIGQFDVVTAAEGIASAAFLARGEG